MPSLSQADRTAGELDWPAWAPRTPPGERDRTHKFSVTLHQAIQDVRAELLDRLDADDWRLSTAAPHRKRDGLPYADSNPDDPGAVVRWTREGEQYAVACDRYTGLRDNIRAIGLYIAEKRKMAGRPVETGQDEFATARLPAGDETAIVAEEPPHEVLGVAPNATVAEIRTAYRERVKVVHPDRGGSVEAYQRVQRAKEQLLDA